MMNFIVFYISFAILFNLAYALKIGQGECPEPKEWIKEKVEPKMFTGGKSDGKWFVVVSNDKNGDNGLDCRYFQYTDIGEPNQLNVSIVAFTLNSDHSTKEKDATAYGKATFGDEPGQWKESQTTKHGDKDVTFNFKNWLIYSDEEYSLKAIYLCDDTAKAGNFEGSLHIIAPLWRAKIFDPEVIKKAKEEAIKSLPAFKDNMKFRMINYNECIEKP